MQNKMSQRTPTTTTGRVFSSNFTTPGISFVAAFRSRTGEQEPQTLQVAVAGPSTMEPCVLAALLQHEEQTTGKSFRDPNIKFSSGENVESSGNGSTAGYDRV
jgi:ABC-type phosphate transport system substrate-binding protein